MIIHTPLLDTLSHTKPLPFSFANGEHSIERYIRGDARFCASIVGILLGRFFAGLASVSSSILSIVPRLSLLPASLPTILFSHKGAGKYRCHALPANISECDLALIPPLYPPNLNNGDRANSPSVAVNLRTHSMEFIRAVENLSQISVTHHRKIYYPFT